MVIKKRIYSAILDALKVNHTVSGYFKSFNPVLAPEGSEFPFVVYEVIVSVPSFSTGPGYHESITIQVDSYSYNFDELTEVSEIIKDVFNNSVWVPLDDGFISRFIRTSDWIWEDPDRRSESGDVVFRHTLNMVATVSREKH